MRQKGGMVFQHFNLFPHMTALQNSIEAPIRVKRIPAAEARKRAMQPLDRVCFASKCAQFPARFSGGEQLELRVHGQRAGDGPAT